MEISISKLFSMFNTESDQEIVQVKVGDLKKLINEKNRAVLKEAKSTNTIRDLRKQEKTLRDELSNMDKLLSDTASIRAEHIAMQNNIKKLKEKLALANTLIEVKNAKIACQVAEKPLLVNLYG